MTSTEENYIAFETVVSFYQENLHKDNGSFESFAVTLNLVDPNTKQLAVGVTLSDFLADVDTQTRRVLTPEDKRFFDYWYKSGKQLATLEAVNYVDRHVRRTLGARFIQVGLFPLSLYAS